MKCKYCKEAIDEDSKFCPSCGEKVEKEASTHILDVGKEFIDHLEFLGYEVNKLATDSLDFQRYSATSKSNKPNLIFNSIEDVGVSFASFFILNEDKARKNHKELLETINRMNNKALFCCFTISQDLNNFVCSAMYLGKYNKKHFADFLDLFKSDIQNSLNQEDYLKGFS